MNIGVFDSGVGGRSVCLAIKKALPDHEIIYRDDKANIPYGSKTKKELFKLVLPILQDLERQCSVIVIACNTVSTQLAEELRKIIKIPIIAMEPMVKPAAGLTKSKIIAVCATPSTLASARYAWLKGQFAEGVEVLEPDCSDWSSMIEAQNIDVQKIDQAIDECCQKGADVIVLGCTHYHWIEEEINKCANGRAIVLQPVDPVVRQLKRIIDNVTA